MAARRLCALLALLACAGRGSGLGDHALFEAAKKGDVGATRTALDRATAHAASKPEARARARARGGRAASDARPPPPHTHRTCFRRCSGATPLAGWSRPALW